MSISGHANSNGKGEGLSIRKVGSQAANIGSASAPNRVENGDIEVARVADREQTGSGVFSDTAFSSALETASLDGIAGGSEILMANVLGRDGDPSMSMFADDYGDETSPALEGSGGSGVYTEATEKQIAILEDKPRDSIMEMELLMADLAFEAAMEDEQVSPEEFGDSLFS